MGVVAGVLTPFLAYGLYVVCRNKFAKAQGKGVSAAAANYSPSNYPTTNQHEDDLVSVPTPAGYRGTGALGEEGGEEGKRMSGHV